MTPQVQLLNEIKKSISNLQSTGQISLTKTGEEIQNAEHEGSKLMIGHTVILGFDFERKKDQVKACIAAAVGQNNLRYPHVRLQSHNRGPIDFSIPDIEKGMEDVGAMVTVLAMN